ncbi:MAG: hypothetical protein HY718_01680 [Planctomycetes bacterium]|nr:hypothetical protein [Planctomycetota bacterium]
MSAISGIGPVSGGIVPPENHQPAGAAVDTTPANTSAAGSLAQSSSILSLSTTSINASSESLMIANTSALAGNDAVGAALLLLVLQYLQTSDPTEKQNLLSIILAIAGAQQQQTGETSTLMYSSSSLSIETTQMTYVTSDALSAYSGATANQQAPQIDPGAAGLDMVA